MASTGCVSARTRLIAALAVFSNVGSAQEASELGNLIFEPTLLSAAIANPIDPEGQTAIDSLALQDSVNRYSATIERLRQTDASDPDLIEQLTLLGIAYQGLDRHEEAIEAIDEAIALTIENRGDNNPEQISLHEQKISSYRALNDTSSIDETENRIYSLKGQNFPPGSRDMYYATTNLADWLIAAYFNEYHHLPEDDLRGLSRPSAEQSPRMGRRALEYYLSLDVDDPLYRRTPQEFLSYIDREPPPVSKPQMIEDLYARYQIDMRDGGDAQLDVVLDLAKRIAQLAFLTKREMEYLHDQLLLDPAFDDPDEELVRYFQEKVDAGYSSGKAALEYVVTVLKSIESLQPEAIASAQLDLGDWHLSYGQARAAEEAYRSAYQTLLGAGYSPENIDIALATEMPPRIPLFATHLYTRGSAGLRGDARLDFTGHIDVNYVVDELGNADRIRFLDSSAENSDTVEKILELHLNSTKFRPALIGGELNGPGEVSVRYYYSY